MPESLRGRCLVATSQIRDPNFYKTVVLIVEHGDHGAMGLVINRPSSILVRNALSEHFELPTVDDFVFVGGPVEPAALLILHNAEELSGGECEVVPEVFIGNSAEAFEHVVREAALQRDGLKYRIYCGCAGWAPGQLEGELARGDWFIACPNDEVVYTEDPYETYPRVLDLVHREHRILPHTSPHPQWN